jgi:hypothetical protein
VQHETNLDAMTIVFVARTNLFEVDQLNYKNENKMEVRTNHSSEVCLHYGFGSTKVTPNYSSKNKFPSLKYVKNLPKTYAG